MNLTSYFYISKMEAVNYKQAYTDIKDILIEKAGTSLVCAGWVRNTRSGGSVAFIELYDGSSAKTLQVITETPEFIEVVKGLSVGASIKVKGTVVHHPIKAGVIELRLDEIQYVGSIKNPLTYILNAKKTSLESLRAHQELRVKSRSINAVMRIRAGLHMATHLFWNKLGFHHLNPNIITSGDCEGGGEVFTVTTLLGAGKVPANADGSIDYSKDFFHGPAYLTVSSQLQLEMLCAGLGKVWASNKSFRAEKSKTTRHLAEFEHIEWESAWCDLTGLMDQSETYTMYCFNYVLEKHMEDLLELDKFISKGIIDRLKGFVSGPYARISYDAAIEILREQFPDGAVKWGDDLGSECEMFLAETVFKKPLFVYNYPASLKSFYMKANDDGRTVQGCDLLIPCLGELIGSSVREHDYDKLMSVIKARKMDPSKLGPYLELRMNGSTPTAGAGLGFDRLVRICTGMENIRDAVPFPISYQEGLRL
jgi:asparaginyl-tRNA synthetase